MFKLPALPAGATKRKFPDAPTEGMPHFSVLHSNRLTGSRGAEAIPTRGACACACACASREREGQRESRDGIGRGGRGRIAVCPW